MGWKLSHEMFNVLNRYLGSGDFPNAEILFFGNEEGLGGKELVANLVARTTTFGERDEEGNVVSSLNSQTTEKGYWEPSAAEGGDKVHALLYQQGLVESPVRKPFVGGYFLPMAARICLALERPDEDPTYWFKPKGGYYFDGVNAISEYIANCLFRKRDEGIRSSLSDWRPLPRVKESSRPSEYECIDWKKYSKAYSDPLGSHDISYSDASRDRANNLSDLLRLSKIKLIIGFGDISTKANMLSKLFPNTRFNQVNSVEFPSVAARR